jgi:hypothetical protein
MIDARRHALGLQKPRKLKFKPWRSLRGYSCALDSIVQRAT